jgi:hypothetical protein
MSVSTQSESLKMFEFVLDRFCSNLFYLDTMIMGFVIPVLDKWFPVG